MAHFAKLDENNVVLEVAVVNNNELIDENGQETEAKGIDFLVNWSGGYTNWKQTSYNGKFRKNYAGIGFSYDQARDAFIYPKIYNSWILNEETCKWEAPVPMPNDGKMYSWDEESQTWVEVSNGD
jgi:hypothetical protein